MRRPKRLLIIVLAGALLVVLAMVFLKRPSVKYQGKSLGYWFRESCETGQFGSRFNIERSRQCEEAFKAMGTNAVPYLVEQAFDLRPDSAAWLNVCRFLSGLPPSWRLPRPVPSATRVEEASKLLEYIKPPAAQLLPLMEKHLKATNLYEHRQTLFILGTAGDGAEQAVPNLIAALKEDSWTRQIAIQSLGWIGHGAQAAAPRLIEIIHEPPGSNYLGLNAAIALGRIGGTGANPAIPEMKKIFEREKNWNLRGCVGVALMQIDPTQTEVLDFLIEGLTNHQPASDRWMAASYLADIGPAAKAATPVLLRTMSDTNLFLGVKSAEALKSMGINTDAGNTNKTN